MHFGWSDVIIPRAAGFGLRSAQADACHVQLTIFVLFDVSLLQPIQTPFYLVLTTQKKIAVQTTDVCAGPRPPLLKRMTCSCTLAKFHTSYCSESSEAGDMITRVTDAQLPASISYRFSCPKPAEKAREIWPERHNCAAKKERQPKGWEGWLKQSFYAARQKHKSHFSYRGGCGVWPAVLSQWSTTCGASVGLDHIKGAAWKNACGAWWEDARRLVTTAFLSA